MQTYARANKLPLDVMKLMTEVTSKTVEQVRLVGLGISVHGWRALNSPNCQGKHVLMSMRCSCMTPDVTRMYCSLRLLCALPLGHARQHRR
jgi:hypothetical protein